MRALFVFVTLSCVALGLAGYCPNGGFCDGVCCESFFHWGCCPAKDGVCCEGGLSCCPGGSECFKYNGTVFCLRITTGPEAGSQKVSLDAKTSFSTLRLSPKDPEVAQVGGFEQDG